MRKVVKDIETSQKLLKQHYKEGIKKDSTKYRK